MIYKKNFCITIFAIYLCILTTNLFAKNIAKELQKKIDNIQTMQANFNYRLTSKNQITESNGNILLKKPGKFNWQITSPQKKTIIADGKYIWDFDPNLKQVIVQKMSNENLAGSPAIFLSGYDNRLTKYYRMNTINHDDDSIGYQLVAANPNTQIEYIYLKFKNEKIMQMHIKDRLENMIDINFAGVKINHYISDNKFKFNMKDNIDVIYN